MQQSTKKLQEVGWISSVKKDVSANRFVTVWMLVRGVGSQDRSYFLLLSECLSLSFSLIDWYLLCANPLPAIIKYKVIRPKYHNGERDKLLSIIWSVCSYFKSLRHDFKIQIKYWYLLMLSDRTWRFVFIYNKYPDAHEEKMMTSSLHFQIS